MIFHCVKRSTRLIAIASYNIRAVRQSDCITCIDFPKFLFPGIAHCFISVDEDTVGTQEYE